MRNVFIAGHNGMVGGSLVRSAPKDTRIVTVQRSSLDLEDSIAVLEFMLANDFDTVILAAAHVGGIEANSKNQMDFLLKNMKIQNAVIEGAAKAGVRNLVFLGSSCVYPKFSPQPIREDALLTGPLEATNEGYALAKISGIRLCKAIHDELGFNYFSLMPTNLYGPNDNYDLESSHVPAALLRRFHDAKINGLDEVGVWGTGSARREFMHVDDLALATWQLIDHRIDGEWINVGTGKDLEIRQFANLIATTVGYEGDIVYDMSKPDGTPRKLLDVAKINSYGWKYSIELEQGLERTYAWFLNALERGEVRGY